MSCWHKIHTANKQINNRIYIARMNIINKLSTTLENKIILTVLDSFSPDVPAFIFKVHRWPWLSVTVTDRGESNDIATQRTHPVFLPWLLCTSLFTSEQCVIYV